MKCTKCGFKLNDTVKFCAECGAPAPKPEPPKLQEPNKFPDILTIMQVAQFLTVSRCTVYSLMEKEGLPWFFLGPRKRRVLKDELVTWLKSRQKKTLQVPA